MPNIASVLKAEIARVARKQVRAESAALKQTVTRHRTEIASLKRQLGELTRELRDTRRQTKAAVRAASVADESTSLRFNAKGFASHRRRLGLSAADCGRLLGVSGQSVYLWESGKARPRAGALPAIAELRAMGKKQAAERLAALG
jgi:DNA-binding transcriptional regulator YiaG